MARSFSSFSLQEVMEAVPAEDVMRWQLKTPPHEPSALLQETLRQRAATFDLTQSDAAKQVQTDALLMEAASNYHPTLKIWKAEPLEIDQWAGVADCLFAPKRAYCAAPFLCVGTVARRDDFEQGFVECLAAMLVCRAINEKAGFSEETFGFASNGQAWQLYRLSPPGIVWESDTFTTLPLPELLGALNYVCAECAKNAS